MTISCIFNTTKKFIAITKHRTTSAKSHPWPLSKNRSTDSWKVPIVVDDDNNTNNPGEPAPKPRTSNRTCPIRFSFGLLNNSEHQVSLHFAFSDLAACLPVCGFWTVVPPNVEHCRQRQHELQWGDTLTRTDKDNAARSACCRDLTFFGLFHRGRGRWRRRSLHVSICLESGV